MLQLDIQINNILNMDCLDFMRQCPDNFFDLVLTDPPYGISCDGGGYGLGINPKKMQKKNWDMAIPSKIYWDEIFRVSKNQIIFGGNYFTKFLYPTKAWIIWDKIGYYKLKNNFSECEMIWTSFDNVTKKYTHVQQGFINDDKNENKFRTHPTQKPLKLIEMILIGFSVEGQLILDCYSGSGTTAVACHKLNRNFVCVEKDFDYYNDSVKRLKDVKKQLKLF